MEKVLEQDSETGVYRFSVGYSESIAAKTTDRDPKSLAWVTDYATDEKFPDDRTGVLVRTGRIMRFDKCMGQDEIERLVTSEGRILACGKELIDFSKSFPRPALDDDVPLVAAGQFWVGDMGGRHCLCLLNSAAVRGLSHCRLFPDEQWGLGWRFLVLDM